VFVSSLTDTHLYSLIVLTFQTPHISKEYRFYLLYILKFKKTGKSIVNFRFTIYFAINRTAYNSRTRIYTLSGQEYYVQFIVAITKLHFTA